MNIKFLTLLLASLVIFSFTFFISAPEVQARVCINVVLGGGSGGEDCWTTCRDARRAEVEGNRCESGTGALGPVGMGCLPEEQCPAGTGVSGCCKVQCPDASIRCEQSDNFAANCHAAEGGRSAAYPGSAGCGTSSASSITGVANTLCRDVPGCPQYRPPPAPSGAGAGAGTGAAGGGGGGASVGGGTVALPNPLGTSDFKIIIGRLIQALTGLVGSIALLMFIYGGFQWLTSAGNPEKIKKGQDIILWAVIGLFLMFIAYFVIRYFLIGLTEGIVPPR